MKPKHFIAIFLALAVGMLPISSCDKPNSKQEHEPIYIEFDVENSEIAASEGDTLTVNFSLSGAVRANTVVSAEADADYTVKVNQTSTSKGSIELICPEVYSDGKLNVSVSDGTDYSFTKVLTIYHSEMVFPQGHEYKVSAEAGEVSVPLSANFGFKLQISASDGSEDASWITTNTKAAVQEQNIVFQVTENKSCSLRYATVSFSPANGSGRPFAEISIIQLPVSKYTFTVNEVSFDMVLVEEGIVEMEDKYWDVNFGQRVLLTHYYIGTTEVTQELWKAVMGKNPSSNKKANHPVDQVSWYNCISFTDKLKELTGMEFRLPTEAQWEFAARGGNLSKGYTYSGSDDLDEVAWYKSNSGSSTHEVAAKKPNELGLYDMSGNVSEWCYDFFGWYPTPLPFTENTIVYVDRIRPETDCDDYGTLPPFPQYDWDRCLRGGNYGQTATVLPVIYIGHFDPSSEYYRNGLRLALPLFPTTLPPLPEEPSRLDR